MQFVVVIVTTQFFPVNDAAGMLHRKTWLYWKVVIFTPLREWSPHPQKRGLGRWVLGTHWSSFTTC